MTCKEIEEKIAAYQEGMLSPEERKLVDDHLVTCPKCSSALADLEKAIAFIEGLPEIEPPPWFTQKIMAQVREEAPEKGSLLKRLIYPFHVKIPIEALATLCVVALGLYAYKTSGPEIKTYQTPPPATIESPSKDSTVDRQKEEIKDLRLSETKIDEENFDRKEPHVKPPVQTEARRPSSGLVMEQKAEAPVATGVAPPAAAPLIAKEKDVSVSTDNERKQEREKKVFQLAPGHRKAEVQIPASITITLSVENIFSASTDAENLLRESGFVVTRKEYRDGIQTLTVHCPAQKLSVLLNRLQAIGYLKDPGITEETTDGNVQVHIRIISR